MPGSAASELGTVVSWRVIGYRMRTYNECLRPLTSWVAVPGIRRHTPSFPCGRGSVSCFWSSTVSISYVFSVEEFLPLFLGVGGVSNATAFSSCSCPSSPSFPTEFFFRDNPSLPLFHNVTLVVRASVLPADRTTTSAPRENYNRKKMTTYYSPHGCCTSYMHTYKNYPFVRSMSVVGIYIPCTPSG